MPKETSTREKDCFAQTVISSEPLIASRKNLNSSGNLLGKKSVEKIALTFHCIRNTKDPNDELNDEFFKNIDSLDWFLLFKAYPDMEASMKLFYKNKSYHDSRRFFKEKGEAWQKLIAFLHRYCIIYNLRAQNLANHKMFNITVPTGTSPNWFQSICKMSWRNVNLNVKAMTMQRYFLLLSVKVFFWFFCFDSGLLHI